MPEFHPLQIEIEQEEDGRLLASVPELPEAVRKAKSIALQILADMIENGESGPALTAILRLS